MMDGLPELLASGLAIAALLVAIGSLILVIGLRRRVAAVTPEVHQLARRLRRGSGAQAITELFSCLEDISRKTASLEAELARLQASYEASLQHVGLVRFNLDDTVAGNLSFALAALDGRLNGFVIASLHSLEGSRVYVRAVREGKAERELLPEEQEALAQATGGRSR